VAPGTIDSRLRCIQGRDATAAEAELLRDFLWENGRGEVMKRDGWTPSLGAIRRTYSYKRGLSWRSLSYVGYRHQGPVPVKRPVFFLPADCLTEEEEVGLIALEGWRRAYLSLADE
jgi:hypothetical protein